MLSLLVFGLLLYIWKDIDDDEADDDFHPKALEPSKKQVVSKPETMHLMTVSCGRPNYQVRIDRLK